MRKVIDCQQVTLCWFNPCRTHLQLALQSGCIMLSNKAKPLSCLSLGFSSAALTFMSLVKSIILTLLLKMKSHY